MLCVLMLTSICVHTFASNWQPPYLNQRKGVENKHRNDFVINLHESYVSKLEVELVSPGSEVQTRYQLYHGARLLIKVCPWGVTAEEH